MLRKFLTKRCKIHANALCADENTSDWKWSRRRLRRTFYLLLIASQKWIRFGDIIRNYQNDFEMTVQRSCYANCYLDCCLNPQHSSNFWSIAAKAHYKGVVGFINLRALFTTSTTSYHHYLRQPTVTKPLIAELWNPKSQNQILDNAPLEAIGTTTSEGPSQSRRLKNSPRYSRQTTPSSKYISSKHIP